MLLILLLISGDLRLFQALVNAEDNFKSSGPVENKRHTNAHQASPPSQQQRLQTPLLRQIVHIQPVSESYSELFNSPVKTEKRSDATCFATISGESALGTTKGNLRRVGSDAERATLQH